MSGFDPVELAGLAHDLVAIPSVTGDEAAIVQQTEARLGALPHVRIERIGLSLVARAGADDADALVLVGHLDTVPPWDGHTVTLSGTRVTGRGAADMKGGDAAIIAVLEACAHAARPLVVVLYDGEEGGHAGNGIHRVLAESRLLGRPPFAFVAEPTACTVHAGCVGVVNADVVFTGRTAHSARPWEGENAITAAAPFLARAAAATTRAVEVDGLRFFDTLAVTGARGGVARNMVPDRFEVSVNVRIAPGRDLAVARRELEALAGQAAEVRFVDEAPPAPPALSDPTLQAFLAQTGVDVHPKQAWTDVATLSQAGIPAVNYGPGDPAQAHQPGEWVDGTAIAEVATRLLRFIEGRTPTAAA